MRRIARWWPLVLLPVAVLGIGIGTLRASEPPLCPGAVELRQQLQEFQTYRFYLIGPPANSHAFRGVPWILHLRQDGRVVVDSTGGMRWTWDGSTLWKDHSDAISGIQAPPAAQDRWFAPFIGPVFDALRQGEVDWYARGPGYHGWVPRDYPQMEAELVHPLWANAGLHVFLTFDRSPPTPAMLEIYDRAGERVWNALIVRTNYNLSLPNLAFSPVAPPLPVFFPEVCPDGQACADSVPPGPIGG